MRRGDPHGGVRLPDDAPLRGHDARPAGQAHHPVFLPLSGGLRPADRRESADLPAVGAGAAALRHGGLDSAGAVAAADRAAGAVLPVTGRSVRHGHRLAAGHPGAVCGGELRRPAAVQRGTVFAALVLLRLPVHHLSSLRAVADAHHKAGGGGGLLGWRVYRPQRHRGLLAQPVGGGAAHIGHLRGGGTGAAGAGLAAVPQAPQRGGGRRHRLPVAAAPRPLGRGSVRRSGAGTVPQQLRAGRRTQPCKAAALSGLHGTAVLCGRPDAAAKDVPRLPPELEGAGGAGGSHGGADPRHPCGRAGRAVPRAGRPAGGQRPGLSLPL